MTVQFNNAIVSFRIAFSVWISKARFDELLSMFEKYKGVTDEVTFFTSESHSWLSLDMIQDRVRCIKYSFINCCC